MPADIDDASCLADRFLIEEKHESGLKNIIAAYGCLLNSHSISTGYTHQPVDNVSLPL